MGVCEEREVVEEPRLLESLEQKAEVESVEEEVMGDFASRFD